MARRRQIVVALALVAALVALWAGLGRRDAVAPAVDRVAPNDAIPVRAPAAPKPSLPRAASQPTSVDGTEPSASCASVRQEHALARTRQIERCQDEFLRRRCVPPPPHSVSDERQAQVQALLQQLHAACPALDAFPMTVDCTEEPCVGIADERQEDVVRACFEGQAGWSENPVEPVEIGERLVAAPLEDRLSERQRALFGQRVGGLRRRVEVEGRGVVADGGMRVGRAAQFACDAPPPDVDATVCSELAASLGCGEPQVSAEVVRSHIDAAYALVDDLHADCPAFAEADAVLVCEQLPCALLVSAGDDPADRGWMAAANDALQASACGHFSGAPVAFMRTERDGATRVLAALPLWEVGGLIDHPGARTWMDEAPGRLPWHVHAAIDHFPMPSSE